MAHTAKDCTEVNAAGERVDPLTSLKAPTDKVRDGDLFAWWSLEATAVDALQTRPVEYFHRLTQVVEDKYGERSLADVPNAGGGLASYHSLVNPGVPIPAAAIAVHGITDAEVADAPSVVAVADAAVAHIAAVVAEHRKAGRPAPRVWSVGHNSDSYDMVCMEQRLGAKEPGGVGWVGRLQAAGVVGTIDTQKILSKKYFGGALQHLGFNGSNGSLGKIYKVVIGEELPNAHRAAGDVNGGIEVVKRSNEMKELILTKKVGRLLNGWSQRQRQLKERRDYVAEMRERANIVGPYEGPADARAPDSPPAQEP